MVQFQGFRLDTVRARYIAPLRLWGYEWSSSIETCLSPEAQLAFRFGMNGCARLATNSAETEQRQTSINQVRAIRSLGNLPLAVLTSTKLASFYRDPLPSEPSGRLLELVQKTVWAAEVDMSRLSSNSTIAPVERSGHYIQFDRPDVVIHAVQTMVESAQGR